MDTPPSGRDSVPTIARSADLRAQLVDVLYQRALPTIYANTGVVVLSIAVLWSKAPRDWLAAWVVLACAVTLVRLALVQRYRRAKPATTAVARWAFYFAVTVTAWGILWGSLALVVFGVMPPHPVLSAFFIAVMAGISAGAVSSMSAYPPAAYGILVPILTSTALGYWISGQESSFALAGIAVVYLAVLVAFVRNGHRTVAESIALRFENLHLIERLREEKAEAERANAAKTHFLAAASHDLRQPLHAMGLFVSALDERVRGAVTRKLVAQLGASMEALRGLLDGLLDISRLDAGVVQPRIGDCALQELFDRLAHDYAAAAEEKRLRLAFVATKLVVRSDPALVERIVRNLVSNAIRYTRRGGVVVGARRRGTQVLVTVCDSGVGIAGEELGNIFREFYQIGNPERDRSKGLGLGLAIARRLAQLLDCRLDVVSILGRGSAFTLTLPRSTASTAERPAVTASTSNRLPAATILVIDDERAILDSMQALLESWGCKAVLADSGEGARAALARERGRPDIIIADYRLRDGERGADAIKRLHAEHGADIPAIIITGDTAPERLREAQASGYFLLAKPLAPAQLRALLRHVLSER